MEDRVRVGVIGVGYLGSIHARIYSRMPNVDLVVVSDVDEERATAIATECRCDHTTNFETMIGTVDAVSVVVPTSLHRAVATPFIENGIHLLLEKPIAHNLSDAESIVALARQHQIRLQIGHLERFNAGVVKLADTLDRPRFIEAHRLGEFVERATDVDVVTDLMIHDIDIVLSLVDSELTYVSAVGARVVTNHVDIANTRLEFRDGTVANVTASRVSSKKFRRIRVFADACYLALNFNDQQIDIARPGPCPPGSNFPEIVSESISVEPRPPLDAELEHFISCVANDREPLVTGEDGLRALAVAQQVREKIDDSLHTVPR